MDLMFPTLIIFQATSTSQRIASTVDNTDRYGIFGLYDGLSVMGKMAINKLNSSMKEEVKVQGNLKFPPERIKQHISPVMGNINTGYYDYVPGMTYDEPIFMRNRRVPTQVGDRTFEIRGWLHREEAVTSQGLKIIYPSVVLEYI